MTVGIVSYLSQRGLGTMAHDLRWQLNIEHQLVIPDGESWPYTEAWMSGNEFYLQQWEIQRADLEAWRQVSGIDTLVSIETGFGDQTFRWAKELGMRTVLIVMWEAFHPHLPAYQNVDLYIAPSWKCFQELPMDNKLFLPYPVDDQYFQFRQRSGPARAFVHNAGSGGANGRKGTLESIFGFLKADVPGSRLIVRAQQPDFIEKIATLLKSDVATDDPRIVLDCSPVAERSDLYAEGDVLLYPSRLDGHALVTLEAMACGMPVITTDCEPQNEFWKPGYPLAVKVAERKFAGTVNPHALAHYVDIDDLAAKIRWCAEHDMAEISQMNLQIASSEHSWTVLEKRWAKALGTA